MFDDFLRTWICVSSRGWCERARNRAFSRVLRWYTDRLHAYWHSRYKKIPRTHHMLRSFCAGGREVVWSQSGMNHRPYASQYCLEWDGGIWRRKDTCVRATRISDILHWWDLVSWYQNSSKMLIPGPRSIQYQWGGFCSYGCWCIQKTLYKKQNRPHLRKRLQSMKDEWEMKHVSILSSYNGWEGWDFVCKRWTYVARWLKSPSHWMSFVFYMVPRERFELSTSGLWVRRSNQLSYLGICGLDFMKLIMFSILFPSRLT